MQPLYRRLAEEWPGRREALLADLSKNARQLEDDWRRRAQANLPPERPGHGGMSTGNHTGRSTREEYNRDNERDMRQRFVGLASGAQPAVVKVAGFGTGAGAKKLVGYVSRDGEVKIENERGEIFAGSHASGAIARDWQPLLSDRKASQDIGLFEIEVTWRGAHMRSEDAGLQIARHAFKDRPLAVTVIQDLQSVCIKGLAVLLSPTEGRLTSDPRESETITGRLKEALSQEAEAVGFQFTGHGHGVRYATMRLRELVVEHSGQVHDEHGSLIADVTAATKLVHQQWREKLGSSRPRDTLHLIISARNGTDAVRFQDTVRDFLGQEFEGHRYVFGVHDPMRDPRPQREGGKRPHIHAHAVITTLSEYGDRLKPWISDFRSWRLSLAENARANGINMEMTDRREMLTAPAYSKHHVRPISYDGRTEHEGTSISAQRRYDAKRMEIPHLAGGERSRDYRASARQNWQALLSQADSEAVQKFARSALLRFGQINRQSSSEWLASGRHRQLSADQLAEPAEPRRSHASPRGEPHRGNGKVIAEAAESSTQDLRHLEREKIEENHRYLSEQVPARQAAQPHMPEEKKHTRKVTEQHSAAERPDITAALPESRSFAVAAASIFEAIRRLREAATRPKLDAYEREALRSEIKRNMEATILKSAEIPGSGVAHARSAIESRADQRPATQSSETDRALVVPAWQLEQKLKTGDRERDVAVTPKFQNLLRAGRERDRDIGRDEYER